MTTKIFSFVKVVETSMVASVRIARYLQTRTGVPVCWDETIGDEPLKNLVIVNGAYAFAGNTILEGLGRAIEQAENIIWVQNDFTIIPPKHTGRAESPFRKAFRNRYNEKKNPVMFWSTVRNMTRPGISPSGHLVGEGSRYLNWNVLTMDYPTNMHAEFYDRPFNNCMVYYGSFRKERIPYFDRYFKNPKIPIIISSPSRKFAENYSSSMITHEPKFEDLRYDLCNYGLGLYIEDKRSHKEFHSPANRFYEMLSAKVPIVFQYESKIMLNQAGYDVSNWVCDVDEAIFEAKHFLDEQQVLVDKAMNEREGFDRLVGEAVGSLG